MPWFGQGGKKGKGASTTELQIQRSKQIEALRRGNLKYIRSSLYKILETDKIIEALVIIIVTISVPIFELFVLFIMNSSVNLIVLNEHWCEKLPYNAPTICWLFPSLTVFKNKHFYKFVHIKL